MIAELPGCSWLWGQDLNLRPFGYEPNELPGCSTPRHNIWSYNLIVIISQINYFVKRFLSFRAAEACGVTIVVPRKRPLWSVRVFMKQPG